MARVRITHTVLKPDSTNANALIPATGASIEVRRRSDNSLVTVYTGETGGGTTANPLATDTSGRVSAWVDRGAYNLVVSGSGIAGYTMAWDATPGGDATIDAPWLSNTSLPIGALIPFAGSGDVGGWLIADGRAVSRTTYAALFGVISSTYGAGDGSTTFNLPDLRGRTPVGAGQGAGLTNRILAAKGGAEKVTLTAAQSGLPDHEHDMSADNMGGVPISDVYNADNGNGKQQLRFGTQGAGGTVNVIQVAPNGSFFYGVGVGFVEDGARDASQSHENMPPFIAVSFAIRAL